MARAQETAPKDPVTSPDLYAEFTPTATVANGKTIVFLAGDEEYRSEEAFPMLARLLAERHGFHCFVLFPIDPKTGEIDPNNQNNIPGMHFLDQADLIVMGWRFRMLPDEDMQHFAKYFESGKPIMGLRTSTHAFRYPGDSSSPYKKYSFDSRAWQGGFGQQILGETWVSHHGGHGTESTRGVVVAENAEHPVLIGVEDVWGPTDVYGIRSLPEDCVVLMNGQIIAGMQPDDQPVDDKRNDPMMPLVWVRELKHKNAAGFQRIFTTTMGSSTDFSNAGMRRLLVNGAFWAVGLEANINAQLNVDIVGEYAPTQFGFNQFQKGKKPADYQGPQTGGGANNRDLRAAIIDGNGPDWRALGATDFVNVNCYDDTWQWQGDLLSCTGEPVGVYRSAEPYTNFELVLEWRHLREAGNSGVFVWSPKASLDAIKPGQLPEGIECQVLDHGYTQQYESQSGKKADWFTTQGDVFPVGSSKMKPFPPLSPNGVRSFPSANHTLGVGEWNHYYIRAINGEVRLWVNGYEISGGNDCDPATGYIALESEGSPIEFRNIRLRVLK